MSLDRVLEPEVMDTPAEAVEYDSMDHGEVNERFVADLIAAGGGQGDILDLGTGTALLPVELCNQTDGCRVMAADLSVSMLEIARLNVEVNSLTHRIQLEHMDAKQLPCEDAMFDSVISNSIVHHIPDPSIVLREAVRVAQPGGLLFFRDLLRPDSEQQLAELVQTYAGDANEQQRQMFNDSLRAALSLAEIRQLVVDLGFPADSVQATSDRHWTWIGRKEVATES